MAVNVGQLFCVSGRLDLRLSRSCVRLRREFDTALGLSPCRQIKHGTFPRGRMVALRHWHHSACFSYPASQVDESQVLFTVLGVLYYGDKLNQIAVIPVIVWHPCSEKTTEKKYFLQCSLYFNFLNHPKQSMNEADNINVLPTILSNSLPTMLP